jgi:PDZ domain-containing protein
MTEQNPGPLPPPPLEPSDQPAGRRHTVLAVVLSVVGVLLVTIVIAGFLIHLPYVIISPGSATPLDSSVVQIDGVPTYPHGGDVLFLTVQVSTHDPNVWRVVTSWLDPNRDVQKRSTVVGCLSDAQNQAFNTELMDQSQNDAKYVALTRLGYSVPADPVQVRIIEVCRGAPAYGALQPADRVLAVDGHDVGDVRQVGQLVQAHKPGDAVAVTYERGGTTRTAQVTAGKTSDHGLKCSPAKGSTSGTPCLGVTSQQFVTYQFPVNIKINTQLVGGPSGGLAFTLAIVDDLTPGDLTAGKRVAVTGTIDAHGSVGAVGGVEQKAITARANGVQLMIVPKSEVRDARRGAGNLRVVGVQTIDEALTVLQKAGGAEVPPPSTTAARS